MANTFNILVEAKMVGYGCLLPFFAIDLNDSTCFLLYVASDYNYKQLNEFLHTNKANAIVADNI